MIATYGIWKVGGVVVPLNPMYRGELEHIFADAEVKGLWYPRRRSWVGWLRMPRAFPVVVLSDDSSFQVDGPESIFSMFDDLPGAPGENPGADQVPDRPRLPSCCRVSPGCGLSLPSIPAPEDEAIVVYTSGTSGKAKGASGTHASVSSNSRYCVRTPTFEAGDGFLTLAPIFHITGFVCQFIAGVSRRCPSDPQLSLRSDSVPRL